MPSRTMVVFQFNWFVVGQVRCRAGRGLQGHVSSSSATNIATSAISTMSGCSETTGNVSVYMLILCDMLSWANLHKMEQACKVPTIQFPFASLGKPNGNGRKTVTNGVQTVFLSQCVILAIFGVPGVVWQEQAIGTSPIGIPEAPE
ncbi:hypothetical protein C8J57DRAFT_1235431 [Mycena rebaudengoi]|nr:hypothetical protein C8J57DRAFT_1235431 [Mycena rebaudengoi]